MVQVKKIQDLASRLELDVVVPTKADASSSIDKRVFEKESFDRVLLDAPCSALGLRPSLRVGGASAWCASKSTTLTARSLTQHVLYQRLMLRQVSLPLSLCLSVSLSLSLSLSCCLSVSLSLLYVCLSLSTFSRTVYRLSRR
jgi:hypothetical protein